MSLLFTTAAFASAEKIINAALAYDPATRIALSRLAPKILAINVTTPAITLFFVPTENGVRLLGHCEADITTQLQGSPSALLALLKSERMNLKDSGVQVTGNTLFLAELQQILQALDIDWEEILSQVFGDIIGHQSAEFIRHKIGWAKDRATNITRLTREFLTEELHALPSKPEVAFFNQQVDDLRLGVDRVDARIHELLKKGTHPEPTERM